MPRLKEGFSPLDLVALVAVWFCISLAGPLVVFSGAEPTACAFWRLTLSSVMLLPLVIRSVGRFTALSTLAGVALGIHFVSWMNSIPLIGVALSTAIVTTYPLILAGAEWLAREPPSAKGVLGLVVAVGALVLANLSVEALDIRGVFMASVGALAAAAYFFIGRLVRRADVPTVRHALLANTVAASVAAVFGVVSGTDLFPESVRAWVSFVALAALPMLCGHGLMIYLMKKMRASTVTSVAAAEPIGAGLIAWAFLGEPLSPELLTLLIAVWVGVTLVIREEVMENG